MNPAFKAGIPRNGQWVKLDNKSVGICVEPDHGGFKTVGEVITYVPTSRPAIINGDPNKFHVTIVDETGFGTKAHLLVDLSRLTPVTKREEIPAPRLKTCDPKWSPRA